MASDNLLRAFSQLCSVMLATVQYSPIICQFKVVVAVARDECDAPICHLARLETHNGFGHGATIMTPRKRAQMLGLIGLDSRAGSLPVSMHPCQNLTGQKWRISPSLTSRWPKSIQDMNRHAFTG
jgi:hypothetical protein